MKKKHFSDLFVLHLPPFACLHDFIDEASNGTIVIKKLIARRRQTQASRKTSENASPLFDLC